MKRAILCFAVIAAGCGGTWSDSDIEFLRPLPTSKDLSPTPPAANSTQQQGLGPSTVYTNIVTMTSNIDAFIEWITGAIDTIRTFPPTSRSADGRVWGPWKDDQHPGFQDQVAIVRDDTTNPSTYRYQLQTLPPGGQWITLIDGAFVGDRATNGSGTIELHVGVARTAGLGDPSDPNTLEVDLTYQLAAGQAAVTAGIQANSGTGVATLSIQYTVKADGGGDIAYTVAGVQVPTANTNVTATVAVTAEWLADKSGRSDDVFSGGGLAPAILQFSECWDAAFNQVFESGQDTCNGAANCACPAPAQICEMTQGSASACSILSP
jgi:hypothetical protein